MSLLHTIFCVRVISLLHMHIDVVVGPRGLLELRNLPTEDIHNLSLGGLCRILKSGWMKFYACASYR